MLTKAELLTKLRRQPLAFNNHDFLVLVGPPKAVDDPDADNDSVRVNFDDLHKTLLQIYDLNEKSFDEESDANAGGMGFFNRLSTASRLKKFTKLIRSGFRLSPPKTAGRQNKIIVAEGDSWFQFPVFINDIIDWLMKVPNHAIYSMAFAGSWISNILYDGKYVEELSIYAPDVFLISGGGNDLVGSDRIAIMVDKHYGCEKYTRDEFDEKYNAWPDNERQLMWEAQQFVTGTFYAFLWVIKMQYWLLFKSIGRSARLQQTKIITQGYDYAIPSLKKHFSLRFPLQWLVNKFVDTGRWLAEPLLIKGIPPTYHTPLLRLFITEINEVFISLAYQFSQVYHIDSRGISAPADWWDELHLKPYMFRHVAAAYDYCINENVANAKVIRVKDLIEGKITYSGTL